MKKQEEAVASGAKHVKKPSGIILAKQLLDPASELNPSIQLSGDQLLARE